eukprot:403354711
MVESQLTLRALSKNGKQLQEKLKDIFHNLPTKNDYQKVEITSPESIAKYDQIFQNTTFLCLKVKLQSFLQMHLDEQDSGIFDLAQNHSQIVKIKFLNTQKFNYQKIIQKFKDFQPNQNLKTITLDGNFFQTPNKFENTSDILNQGLQNLRFLRKLHIRYSTVTVQDIQQLQISLQDKPILNYLNFQGSSLTYDHSVHLSQIIRHHSWNLKELHLNLNNLKDQGFLQTLEGIAVRYISKGCKYLGKIVQKAKNLTHVGLINCMIGSEGASYLAEGLKHSLSIQTCLLGHNQIDDEGAINLAAALRQNQSLKELELHYNKLSGYAGFAFADGIYHYRTLTRLILKENPIGDVACRTILQTLRYNTSLIILNLESCGLACHYDFEIEQGLIANQTLEVLWLANNFIQSDFGLNLSEVLKQNKVLKMINLQGNSLTDDDIHPILEGLRVNKTCHYISLNTNNFSDYGMKSLREFKNDNYYERKRLHL